MKKQAKKPVSIVEIRRLTGLNQTAFWGMVGCTQSGGSRYEMGRPMPKPIAMLVDLIHIHNDVEAAAKLAELRQRPE